MPAKDPVTQALNEIGRAARGAMAEPEDKPRRGKSISPKLVTLNALLGGEMEHQLVRVVAPEWTVEVQVLNEEPKIERDANGNALAEGIVGYETVWGPKAVSQCQPDVLGAIRNAGIEGDVRLMFKSRIGDYEEFPVLATITQEAQAEPRAVNPNAGLPEMMAMFMAQQERQSQMLLAAVAKMTEKSSQTEREWQRKLEEANQRHAQQMQDMLNRQAAQYQGDKRLQIGGAIEQSFLQATNMAVERTFANMLNPQQPAPQQGAMPGMGMATTPTQMMAQMVQGLKADAEARRVLAQELPGLVGEAAKAPEPTIFEYAQQIIPVFMLLKNMSGKDPNQLENAMRQFAQMRQGPAANVNPITGMPIPDAAPADGDAALAQIAANLG